MQTKTCGDYTSLEKNPRDAASSSFYSAGNGSESLYYSAMFIAGVRQHASKPGGNITTVHSGTVHTVS
jgi:hypothetical protein